MRLRQESLQVSVTLYTFGQAVQVSQLAPLHLSQQFVAIVVVVGAGDATKTD
jgi:hypothetical protein